MKMHEYPVGLQTEKKLIAVIILEAIPSRNPLEISVGAGRQTTAGQ